jgi:hypothetical protein
VAGEEVSPEAKAVDDTESGGSVGKVAGSWIFPTIHFCTRVMYEGAGILAGRPFSSQVYVRLEVVSAVSDAHVENTRLTAQLTWWDTYAHCRWHNQCRCRLLESLESYRGEDDSSRPLPVISFTPVQWL